MNKHPIEELKIGQHVGVILVGKEKKEKKWFCEEYQTRYILTSHEGKVISFDNEKACVLVDGKTMFFNKKNLFHTELGSSMWLADLEYNHV